MGNIKNEFLTETRLKILFEKTLQPFLIFQHLVLTFKLSPMKKQLLLSTAFLLFLSSCNVSRNSMREANYQLWLHHEDLAYSSQLTGKAEQTKVLFLDFERLLGKKKWEYGNFGDLPSDPFGSNVNVNASGSVINNADAVIGAVINGVIGVSSVSRVEQMAMYDLMRQNPGYDMVMFPQFTSRRKWFIVGSKTEVVCKAKLATLKDTRE